MAAQTNKDGAEAIEMENPSMTRPAVLADKLQDGDEALHILQTEFVEYSPEEERRLRWKIDLRLVTVMLIVNGIQFVDKLVCVDVHETCLSRRLIFIKDYQLCRNIRHDH
jgi:hypothetical protein